MGEREEEEERGEEFYTACKLTESLVCTITAHNDFTQSSVTKQDWKWVIPLLQKNDAQCNYMHIFCNFIYMYFYEIRTHLHRAYT